MNKAELFLYGTRSKSRKPSRILRQSGSKQISMVLFRYVVYRYHYIYEMTVCIRCGDAREVGLIRSGTYYQPCILIEWRHYTNSITSDMRICALACTAKWAKEDKSTQHDAAM